MALMENIKFPANAQIFIGFWTDIINFDLYETEWLEDQLYYIPEPEPFNINFSAVGIESTLL